MNFLQKIWSAIFNPAEKDSIWDLEEGERLIDTHKETSKEEIDSMTPAESSNDAEGDESSSEE